MVRFSGDRGVDGGFDLQVVVAVVVEAKGGKGFSVGSEAGWLSLCENDVGVVDRSGNGSYYLISSCSTIVYSTSSHFNLSLLS